MKVLKIILGIVAALIVLFLVIGLIMPNEFSMERYTTIDAPKNAIFAKINDVKAWEEWGPWMKDEAIKIEYGDVTEGVGANYSWKSELYGNGALKMIESVPGEKINNELYFEGGDDDNPMNGHWTFEDTEDGLTKVTWGMTGNIPYPWNAMLIMGENEEGKKMFDEGLANIKALCEEAAKNKTYRGYTVNVIDFPGRNYLAVRKEVPFADFKAFYTENLPKLAGAFTGGNIEMDGMPSGLYYKWDEENQIADMAAAIGYKGGEPNDQFAQIKVEAGKALNIDYFGDYEGVGEAHYAMDDYMKEHGIEQAKLVVEEYVTDPGQEPDTSKWLTKLTYLLEN